MQFTRAVRQALKLRMVLDGPSGAGKSYTAMALATVLAGGEPFAVIDSETGSSDRYADIFTFDRLNLDAPYSPEHYIEAIKLAESCGYAALVVDSITHEWRGPGGVLAEVDRIGAAKYRGDRFRAWADVTPRHNAFIAAMTGARLHIIVTMRSKMGYQVESDAHGKVLGIKKVGMEPEQRDGIEYEFDVVGDMDVSHAMTVSKTRAFFLADQVITKPGEALGRQLLAWTVGGERKPVEKPAPVEAEETPAPTFTPARPQPQPAAQAPQATRTPPQRPPAQPLPGPSDKEMAAMTARFKALNMDGRAAHAFARSVLGGDARYVRTLTREQWVKLGAALTEHERKIAEMAKVRERIEPADDEPAPVDMAAEDGAEAPPEAQEAAPAGEVDPITGDAIEHDLRALRGAFAPGM